MVKIGDKISFNLQNQNGKEISNDLFLGKKFILYFYPKDNTPGCTIQAYEYKMLYPKFLEENVEILGISKDSISSHIKFSCSKNLPFDLLSCQDLTFMEELGIIEEKQMFGKKYKKTVRSSIIVDEKGVIIKINYKVNPLTDASDNLKFIQNLKNKQ